MNTHKHRYLKKQGLNPKESYSIDDLVKISGVKKSILQQVFNRGVGAWKNNPQSVRSRINPNKKGVPKSQRMSKEQWGMARVYSFLNDGKTAKTADKDLKEELQGGGIESKEELTEVKEYALSNTDLQDIIGKTNIFTYPQLENIRSIDELFKKGKNGVETAIMLYLTESNNVGHWIGLIKKGDTVEMFDPYGNKPEKLNKEVGGAMNHKQDPTLLRDKVKESGYKLIYNNKQHQPVSPDINTCGRHAVMRLMFGFLPLDEYNKKIKQIAKDSGITVDDLATGLTHEIIGK